MTDAELVAALAALKAAIREPTRDAIAMFEQTTGRSPAHIEIVLTDVTSSSYSRRRRVVADVRIGLEDF